MRSIKQPLATLALLTPALWTPAALVPTTDGGALRHIFKGRTVPEIRGHPAGLPC